MIAHYQPRVLMPIDDGDNKNVLPRVEASGRWTNLPICQPPELPQDDKDQDKNQKIVAFQEANVKERGTTKPHLLSACVWASASFKTRGKGQGKDPILDTGTRLREWIEPHLMVGFDHIYVFDNSGAQTNATSLKLDSRPVSQIADQSYRMAQYHLQQQHPSS
jgi:hypothetical protein